MERLEKTLPNAYLVYDGQGTCALDGSVVGVDGEAVEVEPGRDQLPVEVAAVPGHLERADYWATAQVIGRADAEKAVDGDFRTAYGSSIDQRGGVSGPTTSVSCSSTVKLCL